MTLRNYAKEQAKRIKKERAAHQPATPTGVGCTEPTCDGEMMWQEPRKKHPELKELARALCDKCGWRGWC